MSKRFWLAAGLVLAELALCAGIIGIFWNSLGLLGARGVQVRPFELDTVSAEASAEQRLPVDGPVTLDVDNQQGHVSVVVGGDDEVLVAFTKTAWGASQAEAEARLAEVQVSVTQNGNAVRVVVTEPKVVNLVGDRRGSQVNFTVTVPAQTSLALKTRFGDLSTVGTTGDVALTTGSGKLTARRITGSLDLRSSFGSVVVEDTNSDSVVIRSGSGELRLDQVQAAGELEAHSDFGAITFNQGGANELTISSNSGNITLTNLAVDGLATVSTDFGRLLLRQVQAGSYDLRTNSGNVTVEGGQGPLKAHTDFGDVDISGVVEASVDLYTSSGSVTFAGTLGPGPHTLESQFGGVRLTLPVDTAVAFDLSTDFGSIRSDLPVTLNGGDGLDQDHWRGTLNGGGASLTIHTNSGDIALLQAQS